jgi:hypothetical protein
MKTENKDLSPEQSLLLISSMIRQAQGNVSSSSFYFLLWGWVITLCNFGMYALLNFTTATNAALVWTVTVPTWIISLFYSNKKDNTQQVTTHLDKIYTWLWIGLGITILPSIIFGSSINWRINAVLLMPVGLATFLSGVILRFKPLIFGGIAFWVAGSLCYIVSPTDQYLVGGIAMILGNLLPGYMLRKINR